MNTLEKLSQFAKKHNLLLQTKGEVGFGRPCVGFLNKHGGSYIDYNSYDWEKGVYRFGGEDGDERLYSPDKVDSYHKHDCLAVLVGGEHKDYDEALEGLCKWVEHLEAQGELEVVSYATGHTGFQAIIGGTTGYAIKFKEEATWEK